MGGEKFTPPEGQEEREERELGQRHNSWMDRNIPKIMKGVGAAGIAAGVCGLVAIGGGETGVGMQAATALSFVYGAAFVKGSQHLGGRKKSAEIATNDSEAS